MLTLAAVAEVCATFFGSVGIKNEGYGSCGGRKEWDATFKLETGKYYWVDTRGPELTKLTHRLQNVSGAIGFLKGLVGDLAGYAILRTNSG